MDVRLKRTSGELAVSLSELSRHLHSNESERFSLANGHTADILPLIRTNQDEMLVIPTKKEATPFCHQ